VGLDQPGSHEAWTQLTKKDTDQREFDPAYDDAHTGDAPTALRYFFRGRDGFEIDYAVSAPQNLLQSLMQVSTGSDSSPQFAANGTGYRPC
jgi:hypothetical protein